MKEQNINPRKALEEQRSKLRQLTLLAMLAALALVFGYVESLLPPLSPFPIKYGLSNIPVVFTLLSLGGGSAVVLSLFKSLFALLTRGPLAASLSLAGGLCSLLAMSLLKHTPQKTSLLMLSAAGALSHNLAQFGLLLLLFSQSGLMTFMSLLPPLLILGLACGLLTGLALRVLRPYLEKMATKIDA